MTLAIASKHFDNACDAALARDDEAFNREMASFRAISVTWKRGDLATPTGAGQPPARAAARLGDPVTIAYRKGDER